MEPGNIFKRKAGTKMIEDRSEELAASLAYDVVLTEDENGDVIIKKVY